MFPTNWIELNLATFRVLGGRGNHYTTETAWSNSWFSQ